jgi:nitroreductase
MDFFDVLRKRHSVREYSSREIPKTMIEKIIKAAQTAPSAGNLRAYKIFTIIDTDTKCALARAAFGQEFIATAPVVLVFCSDQERSASRYGSRGAQLYSVQDATIACAYAQLAATALGLGSCWIGAFDEKEVAKIIKTDKRPVALLPVGWLLEEKIIRKKNN